ncbi:MAG: cell division protein FtsH, partial [Muribaculaceae bacterium]|nr:cell division protein FtsH [Muribaculaceae bacterium]
MASPTPQGGSQKKKPQIKFSMYWMYAVILLFLFAMFYLDDNSVSKEVNYSAFENYITDSINARNHGITKITVDKKKGVAEAQLSDSLARQVFHQSQYKDGVDASIWATLPSNDEFARSMAVWKQYGIYTGPVVYEEGSDITSFLWTFGPILLLIGFWFFIMKRMNSRDGGGPGGVFNVGKSKAQMFDKDGPV